MHQSDVDASVAGLPEGGRATIALVRLLARVRALVQH